MARTTSELMDQIQRLVPAYYATGEALLSAFAASISVAETSGETLESLASFEGAFGKWLTLHAHGYGVQRAASETDASLRIRLRSVEDQVTKLAIEAAVNRLITPATCTVVEWFEGPFLDVDLWLDNDGSQLLNGPNGFLVKVPELGMVFPFGAYLDVDLWLDHPDTALGEAAESPLYAAIINEVQRIKPVGTYWRLVVEP